jgi:hypothetical protein
MSEEVIGEISHSSKFFRSKITQISQITRSGDRAGSRTEDTEVFRLPGCCCQDSTLRRQNVRRLARAWDGAKRILNQPRNLRVLCAPSVSSVRAPLS